MAAGKAEPGGARWDGVAGGVSRGGADREDPEMAAEAAGYQRPSVAQSRVQPARWERPWGEASTELFTCY